ncbi:MAG: type III polyketide synthase [Planctomycetota bacterium]
MSKIIGIGTANPGYSMSQTESAQLAMEVFDLDDRQKRVLNVLYKKAGVQNRHTVLPHRIAMNWVGEEDSSGDVLTATTLGPTTRERMDFFNANAPALAVEAARNAFANAAEVWLDPNSSQAPSTRTHKVEHSEPANREFGSDETVPTVVTSNQPSLSEFNEESGEGRSPSDGEGHSSRSQNSAHPNTQTDQASPQVTAQDITHLVTVSCTGFGAPGFDIELIEQLGLSHNTQRVHVGFMGCHGAVNGMRVAQSLADSQPNANVLLVATECCSLHYRFQYDPDLIMGNALFGDGAAALLIQGSDEDGATGPTVAATGCCLIPDSKDAMSWTVGDHGFEMFISSQVPGLIESHLRPWLESWLAEQDLTLGDIGGWAIHPGGPRILQAAQDALELTNDDLAVSRSVLADLGNMSSPTILFIMQRMLQQRGSEALPIVMIGFGPGLMAEAALLR